MHARTIDEERAALNVQSNPIVNGGVKNLEFPAIETINCETNDDGPPLVIRVAMLVSDRIAINLN